MFINDVLLHLGARKAVMLDFSMWEKADLREIPLVICSWRGVYFHVRQFQGVTASVQVSYSTRGLAALQVKMLCNNKNAPIIYRTVQPW